MYSLSNTVEAKFNFVSDSSPILKAKKKQHTSAFVEELTKNMCSSMELKTEENFFRTQMQYKSRKRCIWKNPLDMQQAMENSTVNTRLLRKVK